MGQSFDSSSKKVGELLGSFERRMVVVPRFQRGYSWEKAHVHTFWTDVLTFAEEYGANPKSARVAPSTPATDLGPGRPCLALEFWMPDRAYVAYMRGKGHYATYGDVRLLQKSDSSWRGSVDVAGLTIVAECLPTGPVTGGAGSAGMQALFPPRSSSVKSIVRVAFAGHREQDCGGASAWRLHGTHPLASGVVLRPATFQFGYELIGGAYAR